MSYTVYLSSPGPFEVPAFAITNLNAQAAQDAFQRAHAIVDAANEGRRHLNSPPPPLCAILGGADGAVYDVYPVLPGAPRTLRAIPDDLYAVALKASQVRELERDVLAAICTHFPGDTGLRIVFRRGMTREEAEQALPLAVARGEYTQVRIRRETSGFYALTGRTPEPVTSRWAPAQSPIQPTNAAPQEPTP